IVYRHRRRRELEDRMERTLNIHNRVVRRSSRLDSAVLAMVLVLMAETMLFAGLIGASVMMRGRSMVWPPADLPRLPWPVTLATTGALLASAVVLASSMRRKVLLAAMLGAAFAGVQAVEWARMLGW